MGTGTYNRRGGKVQAFVVDDLRTRDKVWGGGGKYMDWDMGAMTGDSYGVLLQVSSEEQITSLLSLSLSWSLLSSALSLAYLECLSTGWQLLKLIHLSRLTSSYNDRAPCRWLVRKFISKYSKYILIQFNYCICQRQIGDSTHMTRTRVDSSRWFHDCLAKIPQILSHVSRSV